MGDSCTVVRRAAMTSLAGYARRDHAAGTLAGADPLLRFLALGLARRAMVRAQARTVVDDDAHTARLAWLELARVLPDGAIDDWDAVCAAFEAAGGEAPLRVRRGPWLTLALAVLAVTIPSALYAYHLRTRPFDPRRDAAGAALGDTLPNRAVALSLDPTAPSAPVRARLGASAVRRSIGDAAADRLSNLADAMGDVARAQSDGPDAVTDRFFSSGAAANVALAARGAPYFVDLDVWTRPDGARWPIVYTYYVERERESLVNGKAIRSVHLWRLDRLALGQPYLGYTHPRAGAALVLLDQLETELIQLVLPALGPAERVELTGDGDDEDPDPGADWPVTVESRAGELVREYFAGAEDRATLEHIGALLVRRRAIVRQWKRDSPSWVSGSARRRASCRRRTTQASCGTAFPAAPSTSGIASTPTSSRRPPSPPSSGCAIASRSPRSATRCSTVWTTRAGSCRCRRTSPSTWASRTRSTSPRRRTPGAAATRRARTWRSSPTAPTPRCSRWCCSRGSSSTTRTGARRTRAPRR